MSIYSSVAHLPIPIRNHLTSEPLEYSGSIDVATATRHRCILLTVEGNDSETELLIDAVEAKALIVALTETVRLVREGQANADELLAAVTKPWPSIVVARVPWSEDMTTEHPA